MSLLDYGNNVKMDDNDLAVEKAVEKLTVLEDDISKSKQEKETRLIGGISSQ